ncbi:putative sulfatase [Marinimicrobium koreense]|uniref:Putative sulfatase n=1 Tax=Marinimicrobium koreense TaxID=306545 RepID=A0A3N1NPL7_9GAMM|nr:sulfatase-like hydrolase/transferase [Marinimicrobium koreense]ROQ21704.1 putative sulfatase [Marinimicrobium koreense]
MKTERYSWEPNWRRLHHVSTGNYTLEKLKLYLRCSLLIVVLPAIVGCGSYTATTNQKPNILFILVDDMGFGDLSLTGNKQVETPNIDQLAANGLLQRNFYVASPICSPSRVAFFTGQHPSRYKIHSFINTKDHNHRRGMAHYLPEDAFTLADLTKRAGYATAHIGKWHMGGGRDVGDAPLPTDYGFDESYVSFEGLGNRLLFSDHQNRLSERSSELAQGNIDWRPKHETTEIYFDKTIDFINRKKSQPFYVQLWLNDVHTPNMPSDAMLSRIEDNGLSINQRKFNAILVNMDKQLGRLFSHIENQGLANNTLIILTSDNGPESKKQYYQNGEIPPGSTAGLRGRKWSLYEGGIRMPLLVQWPEKIIAGRQDDTTLITAVDFLPTVAALLGEPPPQSDGHNLLPSWTEAPIRHRPKPIFWEFGSTGDPDAHPRSHLASDRSPKLAIRDNQWKLLVNPDGTGVELYNIATDPHEKNEVSGQHPSITERLTKEVTSWRAGFKH